MYHSMTFLKVTNGEITDFANTWSDWHLVASSRPLFNPPPFKSKKIDIPGGNGGLDLSHAFGYPLFNNRTGSFEFYVLNDYWTWIEAYTTIMRFIHGQKVYIILEDEPECYYKGIVTVNSWKSEKDYSKITLDYDVEPFKYYFISDDDSNVSFTNVITPEFNTLLTLTEEDYGTAPVSPQIIVPYQMDVKFYNSYFGTEYTLSLTENGINYLPEIIFYGPEIKLKFITHGSSDDDWMDGDEEEQTGSYILDSSNSTILDSSNRAIEDSSSTGTTSSAPSVSSQSTSSTEETGDIMIIFEKGGL